MIKKYTYRVTVEFEDDRRVPILNSEIANMIRADVGSWEGSLPSEDQINISKTTVASIPDKE